MAPELPLGKRLKASGNVRGVPGTLLVVGSTEDTVHSRGGVVGYGGGGGGVPAIDAVCCTAEAVVAQLVVAVQANNPSSTSVELAVDPSRVRKRSQSDKIRPTRNFITCLFAIFINLREFVKTCVDSDENLKESFAKNKNFWSKQLVQFILKEICPEVAERLYGLDRYDALFELVKYVREQRDAHGTLDKLDKEVFLREVESLVLVDKQSHSTSVPEDNRAKLDELLGFSSTQVEFPLKRERELKRKRDEVPDEDDIEPLISSFKTGDEIQPVTSELIEFLTSMYDVDPAHTPPKPFTTWREKLADFGDNLDDSLSLASTSDDDTSWMLYFNWD